MEGCGWDSRRPSASQQLERHDHIRGRPEAIRRPGRGRWAGYQGASRDLAATQEGDPVDRPAADVAGRARGPAAHAEIHRHRHGDDRPAQEHRGRCRGGDPGTRHRRLDRRKPDPADQLAFPARAPGHGPGHLRRPGIQCRLAQPRPRRPAAGGRAARGHRLLAAGFLAGGDRAGGGADRGRRGRPPLSAARIDDRRVRQGPQGHAGRPLLRDQDRLHLGECEEGRQRGQRRGQSLRRHAARGEGRQDRAGDRMAGAAPGRAAARGRGGRGCGRGIPRRRTTSTTSTA